MSQQGCESLRKRLNLHGRISGCTVTNITDITAFGEAIKSFEQKTPTDFCVTSYWCIKVCVDIKDGVSVHVVL